MFRVRNKDYYYYYYYYITYCMHQNSCYNKCRYMFSILIIYSKLARLCYIFPTMFNIILIHVISKCWHVDYKFKYYVTYLIPHQHH